MWRRSWFLASYWPSSGYCHHLRIEPTDGRSLFVSVFPFSLCNFNFQIKKKKLLNISENQYTWKSKSFLNKRIYWTTQNLPHLYIILFPDCYVQMKKNYEKIKIIDKLKIMFSSIYFLNKQVCIPLYTKFYQNNYFKKCYGGAGVWPSY